MTLNGIVAVNIGLAGLGGAYAVLWRGCQWSGISVTAREFQGCFAIAAGSWTNVNG